MIYKALSNPRNITHQTRKRGIFFETNFFLKTNDKLKNWNDRKLLSLHVDSFWMETEVFQNLYFIYCPVFSFN